MGPTDRARHAREPVDGTAIAAKLTAGETGDAPASGGSAAPFGPLTCAPPGCLSCSKPRNLVHDRHPTARSPLDSASPGIFRTAGASDQPTPPGTPPSSPPGARAPA